MSPTSRRSYLRALGAAVAVGGSTGCLGGPLSGASYEGPDHEPTRTNGDPISVEHTFVDPPGYDDGKEYFPTNKTFRYTEQRASGIPINYEPGSFERWGMIKTAERGALAVRNTTAARLGSGAGISASTTTPPTEELDPFVVLLTIQARVDDRGQPVDTPAAPFEKILDVAPRSADVTVSIEDDSFSRTVPVYAEGITLKQG